MKDPSPAWIRNRFFLAPTCDAHCIREIETGLKKMAGVREVSALPRWRELRVTHDCRQLPCDAIRNTIKDVQARTTVKRPS